MYPTEWSHGIPRGSIADKKTSYMLRITAPGGKTITNSYKISDFKSKALCLAHAEKMREEISREMDLTRNEIRFLSKNKIEVKLTQDKTFIMDAKHIDIVNTYPLQAKLKTDGKTKTYYVYYQDKKHAAAFAHLLTNFKIVDYINGNTMDLRERNLKEFGIGIDIETKNNTESINSNDSQSDTSEHIPPIKIEVIKDVSKYYFMDITDLPKNKWILGNIGGTIFERDREKNEIVTMRYVDDKDNTMTKTFKVSDYENSVKKTYLVAKKFLINISHHLGLVNNRVKILDDHIEIEANHGITLTDIVFLPLFMPTIRNLQNSVSLIKQKGGSSDLIYSSAYIRLAKEGEDVQTYHSLIMGGSFIDHINRNPLDNRLCNLRYSDYQHNATNKAPSIKDTEGINGVKKIDQHYLAYVKSYKKEFHINELGKKKAKYHCILFRTHILEVNLTDADIEKIIYDKSDINTINFAIAQYTKYKKLHNEKIVTEFEYMPSVKSDHITKSMIKEMYHEYITIQFERSHTLKSKIKQLKNILATI
jgi:hypothetical protein